MDEKLSAEAFEEIRQDLYRLAEWLMGRERKAHTLQPTALLGEVWIKLFAGDASFEGVDRAQLIAKAVLAMRRILTDHARRRGAEKRGGGVMCLVWGLTWWPVKIGAAHVPPIFLAAARFLLAGALMLAWSGRAALAVPGPARGRLLATALLVNTGNYALLFWGVAHAPTGLAAIVNFGTIPFFSLLASRWLEGTPIEPRQLAAIALGTVGLALLFATRALGGPGAAAATPAELWGLAAIALGTLLYCFGAVLSRPIASTLPVLTLAGWQTLLGGIGLCAVSLALEPLEARHLRELVHWPVLPALLFLVVAGSLAGFTIYMKLLRDWGAFRAGLYAFVSPVIAVAVGVVALHERFGWAEGAGAVLMFGAAAVALRRPRPA